MKLINKLKEWFGKNSSNEDTELENFLKEFQLSGENDFRDDLRKILLDLRKILLKLKNNQRKTIHVRKNTIYIINDECVETVDNCSNEFISDVLEILPFLNGKLEITSNGIIKYDATITDDKCVITKKCLVEFKNG